jgi:hypothetical protein
MSHFSGEMFSLAEIADRAALPLERIRYVIDSGILQGGRGRKWRTGARGPGRGSPRAFAPTEAIAVVIVVLMLEGGIRRRVVRDCLELLSASVVPGSNRLRDLTFIRVLDEETIIALEIGDGLNVRLVCQEGPAVTTDLPTDWIQPKTMARLENYDPLLVVRINLAKIRRKFVKRFFQVASKSATKL